MKYIITLSLLLTTMTSTGCARFGQGLAAGAQHYNQTYQNQQNSYQQFQDNQRQYQLEHPWEFNRVYR